MSLIDTNSISSDWEELFQQTLDPSASDSQIFRSFSDSIIVATTTKPSPTASLSPEGRIEKPSKRRTRASRRAPTTLLNTDTTNFRAMVQQFTGISGYQPTGRPFVNFAASRPAVEPFRHLQQQHYQVQPLYQPLEHFSSDNFLEELSSNPRADVAAGQEGILSDGQLWPY